MQGKACEDLDCGELGAKGCVICRRLNEDGDWPVRHVAQFLLATVLHGEESEGENTRLLSGEHFSNFKTLAEETSFVSAESPASRRKFHGF